MLMGERTKNPISSQYPKDHECGSSHKIIIKESLGNLTEYSFTFPIPISLLESKKTPLLFPHGSFFTLEVYGLRIPNLLQQQLCLWPMNTFPNPSFLLGRRFKYPPQFLYGLLGTPMFLIPLSKIQSCRSIVGIKRDGLLKILACHF